MNGGVSTGNAVELVISFENQPLKSLNDEAFGALLAEATLSDEISIQLKGSADVTARTKIGDVPISGIPIDVTSSLKGIGAFQHEAALSQVSVTGSGGQGGNEYIVSPLTTTLDNPSNISLSTVGVSLGVMFEGTKIGRAVINVSPIADWSEKQRMRWFVFVRTLSWFLVNKRMRPSSVMNLTMPTILRRNSS